MQNVNAFETADRYQAEHPEVGVRVGGWHDTPPASIADRNPRVVIRLKVRPGDPAVRIWAYDRTAA